MGDKIMVFVTARSRAQAKKISYALLKEKIAACVSVVPDVVSRYWWKNKIEKSSEALMIIKTSKPALKKLISAVKANHSYDVPEILALDVSGGNADYLKWVGDSVCAKRCSGK